MNRNTGIGLTAFGIVLVAVGAIMRFAVSVSTSGFNIHDAGVILLLVGIGIVVLSLLILALGGKSRSTTRTDVRETPLGQPQIEHEGEPVNQVEVHMPSTQPLTEPRNEQQTEQRTD